MKLPEARDTVNALPDGNEVKACADIDGYLYVGWGGVDE
jgi:hypothetical protein